MSGYKAIVIDEFQSKHWKESLARQGIKIEFEERPEQGQSGLEIEEKLFRVQHEDYPVSILEYFNHRKDEKGLVFLHKESRDLKFIDQLIKIVRQLSTSSED